ncbi:MAG: DUF302 domain-containing protein [Sulfurimonas sp.]|uniref:DUF302 domain-containing protein n=1 Tax=Sulfurimonas sp. TaxID=2022749 RepID=UPI00262474F0|nr:DUF302 domain-containing protein [Sulfurimonas sp.]MCW8894925.1 DUF302 domain-containing protein [Sulfurimonas sp.]MCW8954397.1 DUF302 domain-containing protein [Sulfurimonas sp.]MCW9068205.1 DUF302 domain-containing protein [Sulfurimonas sp.]
MKKILLACILAVSVWAAPDTNVYTVSYKADMDTVEKNILSHFKSVKLVVTYKLDILEEFKHKGLDKKFGAEFNKNKLTSVRTMIICNGKFGNMIMNTDPSMMAYCPVRLTLVEKDGKTQVLFVRPSSAPKSSKAYGALVKLEQKVVGAIEAANEMEEKVK